MRTLHEGAAPNITASTPTHPFRLPPTVSSTEYSHFLHDTLSVSDTEALNETMTGRGYSYSYGRANNRHHGTHRGGAQSSQEARSVFTASSNGRGRQPLSQAVYGEARNNCVPLVRAPTRGGLSLQTNTGPAGHHQARYADQTPPWFSSARDGPIQGSPHSNQPIFHGANGDDNSGMRGLGSPSHRSSSANIQIQPHTGFGAPQPRSLPASPITSQSSNGSSNHGARGAGSPNSRSSPANAHIQLHNGSGVPQAQSFSATAAAINGTWTYTPLQHALGRFAIRRPQYNPALQEIKFVLFTKDCTIKAIHDHLRQYGHIFNIVIKPTVTLVTFQPPPPQAIDLSAVFIGGRRIGMTVARDQDNFTVPSPVNPAVLYKQIYAFYADSIGFSIQVAESTFMEMQNVHAQHGVQLRLKLRRKEVDIKFPLTLSGMRRTFVFRMPLSQLERIYKTQDAGNGQCTLVIPFNSPPQFFEEHFAAAFKQSDKIFNEWEAWYRQTEVVNSHTKASMKSEPVQNRVERAVIDIGNWTSYRLTFSASSLDQLKFQEFRNALADYGIVIDEDADLTVVQKEQSRIWEVLKDEPRQETPEPSSSQSALDDLITADVHLQFPVRYQLEACLSNGYIKEHSVSHEFLVRLSAMDISEAVYVLEKVVDRQIVFYNPMAIFDIPIKADITKRIPIYCVLTRAATITPTMVHISTPNVDTSNRIIRKYARDTDQFLRVRFTDEKTEGKILSVFDNRSDEVFRRIARAMREGIVIAGRHYVFLAFGNSQFREHGAYFYSETAGLSANDIRKAMGSFDHIKVPAKFGARLGQCFSTTRAIKSIPISINQIPDIILNGFTFTDGVGKISHFLAQMAASELGIQNAWVDPPSLYQFRLAGCKGVLALDPNLSGTVVHIRPSQYKFAARNEGLEIIRASAFATACFNRQLIIILSSLGVSDYVFIKKQQEMVNYLERATKEESLALEKLQQNVDLNQTSLTMAAMILDGFMKSKDPFMMSLLQLWRAYHIKYLKEKARIVIEQAAFVLGCIDETANLRGHYDDPQSRPDATKEEKLGKLPQIFLQISDQEKKGHYKVIEGVCILARNPSLHPGDIRVVEAVDAPALHHLKNVVVLPQEGDRDVANMCSGGDLDGDDYIVMWDDDFLPTIINEPPMDFTATKPQELDRPVTLADITDFFVEHMKNDSLATIALAHLAQADFNEDGVTNEKCLELARLHSQAVDYPKNGVAAKMTRELKPKQYPHFMENKYRTPDKIYKSTKILGQLFDQVKLVDFKPRYENAFDNRILDAFELDDGILKHATTIKEAYDSSIKRLMAKHDIRTEFEVWSIFVLSHNQESRDYTFAEEFGRMVQNVKDQYRKMCQEKAGAKNSSDFERMGPFVAAMYTVTAQEMKSALEECQATKIVGGKKVPVRKKDPKNMPLMSFPWLFVSELGRIASGVDRKSASVQQGLARKHLKKQDILVDLEPGMGDIQTKGGVTHFGELLKLNFDHEAPTYFDKEDRRGSEDKQPNEKGWYTTEIASVTGKQGSCDGINKTQAFPLGSKLDEPVQGEVEEEEEQEEEEVKIVFEKKKPSAFDRLARLG